MIIRRLSSSDASLAAPLMAELGYLTTAEAFAERFAALSANPHSAVLVAEAQGSLLGLVAVHSLKAAEDYFQQSGCTMLEVTSNERRADAHAFYAARGYREKRVRFVKNPST